jgi:hypothetical protein
LHVRVLSPVDLAVSKIARFADNDKEDLLALVRLDLTTPDEIQPRALQAMDSFVGGRAMLELNLRDALVLVRAAQTGRE